MLDLVQLANLLFRNAVRVIADSADFAARAIISRSTSIRFMQHVLQAIHSTRAPVACCKCAEYVSLCLKHWRPHEADRLGDGLDSAIVAAVQSATGDARAAGRKAALLLKTILPDRYRCPFSLCPENRFLTKFYSAADVCGTWSTAAIKSCLPEKSRCFPRCFTPIEKSDILASGYHCRPWQ